MAKDRIPAILEQQFNARLTVQDMEVSLFPSVAVSGRQLLFRRDADPGTPPLLTLQAFTARTNLLNLLRRHISHVELSGLRIQIDRRLPKREKPVSDDPHRKPPEFVIDDVSADGTQLTIIPKKEEKPPMEYDLKRLHLWRAGTVGPMSFRATLHNATPPGDIETSGTFGPWNSDDEAQTPLAGKYVFRNANLGVFKGIGGTLSSDGKFHGMLERIEVDGWANVPDFVVNLGGHPVDLRTGFHAIVDGTDGDTRLEPVDARFGKSHLTAQGGIEGVKGTPGKTIKLDVVAEGAVEDMVRFGVRGSSPLTGAIRFRTHMVIPRGDADIARKLILDGAFTIDSAQFTKADLQERIAELSKKGQGQPKAEPDPTVASDFKGRFRLASGKMTLSQFSFQIPGVALKLNGSYGLIDQSLDFRGTAALDAKISQTTTGFKSLLLKAVDPFFKKQNRGSVIPIKITGDRESPKFGLNLGGGGESAQ